MKKIYALSFILLTYLSFGQAFTGTYDFAGIISVPPASPTNGLTDPTPVPTANGVTFGNFSAVISTTVTTPPAGSTGAGRFSYANQPLGALTGDNVYANFTGTLDSNIYFSVTLTPQSGNTVSLSQVTFKTARSSTGIRNYSVRSSIDNYATNLSASISPSNVELGTVAGNIFFRVNDATTSAQSGSTIILSSSSFTNFSAPVTFRFYAWNAEATGGSFSIDDVVFTGSTSTLAVNKNQIAGLSINPNPVSKGVFYVNTIANETKNVVIVDLLGKQVLNTTTSGNEINVSNLNAGVYIVKITEEGKTATRKLVIQ